MLFLFRMAVNVSVLRMINLVQHGWGSRAGQTKQTVQEMLWGVLNPTQSEDTEQLFVSNSVTGTQRLWTQSVPSHLIARSQFRPTRRFWFILKTLFIHLESVCVQQMHLTNVITSQLYSDSEIYANKSTYSITICSEISHVYLKRIPNIHTLLFLK